MNPLSSTCRGVSPSSGYANRSSLPITNPPPTSATIPRLDVGGPAAAKWLMSCTALLPPRDGLEQPPPECELGCVISGLESSVAAESAGSVRDNLSGHLTTCHRNDRLPIVRVRRLRCSPPASLLEPRAGNQLA